MFQVSRPEPGLDLALTVILNDLGILYDDLTEAFEQGGRRCENLQPVDQARFAVAIALAARISDHPLIAGPGGPKLTDMRAVRTRDLSEHGRARQAVCATLLHSANQACALQAAFVVPPTPNSVSAMMQLSLLHYRAFILPTCRLDMISTDTTSQLRAAFDKVVRLVPQQ